MTDISRIITICNAWVAGGLGDECFWEGWPEQPECEGLTPNMALAALRAMQAERDELRATSDGHFTQAIKNGQSAMAERARAEAAIREGRG